jgi:aminomethyltransferase
MGGPKGRRRKEQGFLGAGKFLTEEGKFRKISKKRVGLMGHKAPARGQTEIYDEAGEALIGVVTSGTMSPCLKRPVAMGYVESAHAKAGTKVTVDIRGKKVPTEITAMPFVETHYYRAP